MLKIKMEIIKSLEQLHILAKPCVIALGTFDGLHLGHQKVIDEAKKIARERGELLVLFTFSNHPKSLLKPAQAPRQLLDEVSKQQLLAELGLDVLVEVPFDQQLLQLEPEEFILRLQALGFSCLVVGENFTYGRRGAGNVETLRVSSHRHRYELVVCPLVELEGDIVSSTRIRGLIREGRVEQASRLLGRPYRLSGSVAHGNERGRLLGFPTANLELLESSAEVPAAGVYAVLAQVAGRTYQAVCNIGNNPTFGDVEHRRLEAHLLDFQGDIYGQALTIEFKARLRGEIKFPGVEALREQLERDKKQGKNILNTLQ